MHVHKLDVDQGAHASVVVPAFAFGLGDDPNFDAPVVGVGVENFDGGVEILVVGFLSGVEVFGFGEDGGVVGDVVFFGVEATGEFLPEVGFAFFELDFFFGV